jgi:hypothetical protein
MAGRRAASSMTLGGGKGTTCGTVSVDKHAAPTVICYPEDQWWVTGRPPRPSAGSSTVMTIRYEDGVRTTSGIALHSEDTARSKVDSPPMTTQKVLLRLYHHSINNIGD